MLAIDVEWLEPVYEAALDDTGEWPPHPGRLFFALVAAADPGGADDLALEWLEQQHPPEVHAPDEAIPSTATAFVPTNAVIGDTKSNRVARTNGQRRWHRHHLPQPRVRFAWPEADPDAATVERLAALSRRVPYLGRSTSPALLSVSAQDAAMDDVVRWAPKSAGSRRLRVPYPGQLDALRAAHDVGDDARTTSRWAFYGTPREEETDSPPPHPGAYPSLVVRAFPRGSGLDGRLVVRVATAFRRALLQRLGQDFGEAELALVHGHRTDRNEGRQCAFLALPNVGHGHATGELLGVAVAISPDLPSDVRQGLLRACGLSLDGGGVDTLTVPGVATLPLHDPDRAQDDRWTVNRLRWIGPRRRWVSALPMVLDRYPDRSDEVPEHGADGLEMAGYPRPLDVEHLAQPAPAGVPRFRRDDLRRRRHDPPRPAVHVRVTFDQAVTGPVVAGNMRHVGLGLLIPEAERVANADEVSDAEQASDADEVADGRDAR